MKKQILFVGFLSVLIVALLSETQVKTDGLIPENRISINKDFSNGPTTVSGVLTFDELAQIISEDDGVSLAEAKKSIVQNSTSKTFSTAATATYRALSQQFTVTSTYKPTMRFYCETSESGLFHAIKKLLQVSMIRGNQGISKQFKGGVYANLEDPNRIFYIVNGDFYNNGTTTVNAGVNIGAGGSADVSFGVSNASSHFKYRYVESRVYFKINVKRN